MHKQNFRHVQWKIPNIQNLNYPWNLISGIFHEYITDTNYDVSATETLDNILNNMSNPEYKTVILLYFKGKLDTGDISTILQTSNVKTKKLRENALTELRSAQNIRPLATSLIAGHKNAISNLKRRNPDGSKMRENVYSDLIEASYSAYLKLLNISQIGVKQ